MEDVAEGIRLEKMSLGDPDASGRRKPIPTGETTLVPCDMVIIAIGQRPNPLILDSLEKIGIRTDKGMIVVDDNMQTTNPRFYAGGDIVGGNATVIKAMGDGRKAAASISCQVCQPGR